MVKLIGWIPTNERPRNKTLCLGWRLYWSVLKANHPTIPLQSQLISVLFLCALHSLHFLLVSHLPYQLNTLLLFLQLHLIFWNTDTEKVSLFCALLFLGVLFIDKLLKYGHQPRFLISIRLIRKSKQVQLFSAKRAIIYGNQYTFW